MDIDTIYSKLIEIAKNNNNSIFDTEIIKYYPINSEEYDTLCERLINDNIVILTSNDELDIEDDLKNEIKSENKSFNGDLTKLYLNDIGTIKRISFDEEIELSKLIKIGIDSQNKIDKLNDNIDKEEYDILMNNISKGLEAKNKLVSSNLRLVVSVALNYKGRGLSLSDLIQSGNMGLILAADKFDYNLGYHFSTYATWWIRQSILRSIVEQSRTIRLPNYINDKVNKYNKVKMDLTSKLNREPNELEIAKEMDLSVDEVLNLINYSKTPDSLDKEIGEDKDSTLGDMISSDFKTPLENTLKIKLNETINKALKEVLTTREVYILKLRFGLFDGIEYTYDQIGLDINVTRERVRQLVNRALLKLLNSNYKDELNELRRAIINE